MIKNKLSKLVKFGISEAIIVFVAIAGYAGYLVQNKINEKNNYSTNTPEEIKVIETQTLLDTNQVYTNTNFPTLKLPYTNDWKLSTKTDALDYEKDLVNTQLTFISKQAKVDVYLRFLPIDGCSSGPQTIISSVQVGTLYKTTFQNQNPETNQNIEPIMVAYGANPNDTSTCNEGTIISNINKSNYAGYNDFIANNNLEKDSIYTQENVVYHYTIGVSTPDQDNNTYFKPSDPAVTNIDKLLAGFQF